MGSPVSGANTAETANFLQAPTRTCQRLIRKAGMSGCHACNARIPCATNLVLQALLERPAKTSIKPLAGFAASRFQLSSQYAGNLPDTLPKRVQRWFRCFRRRKYQHFAARRGCFICNMPATSLISGCSGAGACCRASNLGALRRAIFAGGDKP